MSIKSPQSDCQSSANNTPMKMQINSWGLLWFSHETESWKREKREVIWCTIWWRCEINCMKDDISRMCPGHKDYVSVKAFTGKDHRQKRLLFYNSSEVYEDFKEESRFTVGLSKFASLRPPNVLPITPYDQEVCLLIPWKHWAIDGSSFIPNKTWGPQHL